MAQIIPSSLPHPSEPTLQVRSLTASDAEAYLRFREAISHETTHTLQYVGSPLTTPEVMAQRFTDAEANPRILELGVFDRDVVVGCLFFRLPWHDHPWLQHVGQFGMMIRQSHWGRGIGRHLLERQDEFARTIGITRVEAMVRTENERGIKLYRRAGFEIEGIRKQAVFINGRYQDEYFIAKLL